MNFRYLIAGIIAISLTMSMQGQKKVADNKKKKLEIIKDSIVDVRDKKVYKMVKIGNQTWMSENLRFKCEGSFVYDDIQKNLKKLGCLYTYEASKNACPTGSHLPSKQDWDTLVKFLDPTDQSIAVDKLLKKTYPGFMITIGGLRNSKGKYVAVNGEGWYWGSDNTVFINGDVSGATLFINDKIEKKELKNAYSIRCVKDIVQDTTQVQK